MYLAGNLYIGGRGLEAVDSTLRSNSWFVVENYLTVTSLSSGSTALYVDGNGTLSTYSSAKRYKKNIETLKDCSWLYDVRPVMFNWQDAERDKTEGRQIGFIAEEVHALCPQLAWSRDGQIEGVHYERLAVPLIVELQKLRARVNELERLVKTND
jgi:hypothetical protein